MKTTKIMACAVALSLSGAGMSLAQTMSPAPGAMAPGANTGRPTSGTTTGSSNPAVNTTGNAGSNVNATGKAVIVPLSGLEKGANSFTEGQAKSRIEGAGLMTVTDLKKDDMGIWRGKAMRDGKSVVVGFDYKGSIGAE